MNKQTEREQLEDVLHAYQEAAPDLNYATLNEWIRRYPYYEHELTEFTITHNLIQTLPEPVVSEQTEAELLTFGKSVIQSLLSKAQNQEQVALPLSSLLAAGKATGLSLQDIAKHTRLSSALIRKLDRRLIQFATLPKEVIENLAQVLKQKTSIVAQYLQLPPTLTQGASYRAEQRPQLTEPEDFVTAVKNDRSISQEDRHYWLEK